ncbi:MAG: hypothetical protein J6574_08075 [Gilliamella sp.]|nr:hypothetical protein [Gilliamella sp.]
MGDTGELFCREDLPTEEEFELLVNGILRGECENEDTIRDITEREFGLGEDTCTGDEYMETDEGAIGGTEEGPILIVVPSSESTDRVQGETVERRKLLRQLFLERFEDQNRRTSICHQIFSKRNIDRASEEISRVVQGNFRGTAYLVCDHGDHYHVVHDCHRSGKRCRCHRLVETRNVFGRAVAERIVRDNRFDIEHWINLTEYFEKDERKIVYMEICGRERSECLQDREVFIQGSGTSGQEQMVDDSVSCESPVREFVSIGSCGDSCRSGATSGNQETNQTARSSEGGKTTNVEKYIRQFLTSPITHLLSTSYWINSKYYMINIQSNWFQCVMKKISFGFNRMTVYELFEYARKLDVDKLIYSSPTEMTFDYYYDIRTSVYILDELLRFQIEEDEIKEFLETLVAVLDKTIPKKNCIHIQGPPCSGKNLFFDCITSFCINCGHLGNFNKYNSFPMMDCIDKRVIMWNEPVLEVSALETLKMVFGGDTCPVKIKYMGDKLLLRTPVICLSNNQPFPLDDAFKCRMFTYEWKQCDDLKKVIKKPHPLAFPYLLIKYGIWEDVLLNEKEMEYMS